MDVLYIELADAEPLAYARWWLCQDDELSASGTDFLAEIDNRASEQVKSLEKYARVVFLPDREVLYIEVEIPGRSQARVRQAAPFAVEPHLTEEIDEVHIALGEIKKSGVVPCMVINRARFETYLAVIKEAGISPTVITTPSMMVSATSNLYLFESNESVAVRTWNQLAVVAPEALVTTLSAILANEEEKPSMKCVGTQTFEFALRQAVADLDLNDVEIELVSFDSILSEVKALPNLLNLLQGSFAVKDSGATIRQIIHRTALVASACALVVSAIAVMQGFWAGFQANKTNDESLDVFESVYNTRAVSGNPVFRMQERMGARSDEPSSWLILFESVVGATAGVEIQSLDFNEAQNRMSISFYAESFQEFEAVRSRMTDLGVSVVVNFTEQQQNRVWSRIALTTK